MRENEGFDILHNGVPRRDTKAMAYAAARFATTENLPILSRLWTAQRYEVGMLAGQTA